MIETLREGDALPTLEFPMDRTFVVAAALASQDFEDVHHDPSKAQDRGLPDIFISINSTNGLIDRYITDWAGPSARLLSVSLRLGVPAHPGDVLVFDGQVKAVDDGAVTVALTGKHERGTHVTSEVVLRWDEEAFS